MGRTKQPEIRERLLHACTDHVLAHGVPDRLAPLAAAAGTSPRMLLYHFTTKDALLREVLREARARQRRDFGELLRPRPDEPYPATLRRAWTEMTDGPARRYVAVFNPLREDADQRLWPGFRVEATTDWLEPLREGLAAVGRPELATVVLAVIRGLLVDLEATGDRHRTEQAWQHFVDLLGAGPVTATVPR
ncbi:TetR/AcrR family transcriptional regulator [Quadrisphaera sp. INWT6]|uniref:TetR/AcrR family transcriptional regulator n=1 Tax=Quadrisphaera sp. INWT6 TaxID=2596917 RepID=UPI0018926A1D|nr:TetR/AcrR family transcriptional regulator [Quadrisphaera sp. INWT6]MBF5080751.1 TetR/AcrR family transcriptional regulator [Quadrisphaera sp. INWT6]